MFPLIDLNTFHGKESGARESGARGAMCTGEEMSQWQSTTLASY